MCNMAVSQAVNQTHSLYRSTPPIVKVAKNPGVATSGKRHHQMLLVSSFFFVEEGVEIDVVYRYS